MGLSTCERVGPADGPEALFRSSRLWQTELPAPGLRAQRSVAYLVVAWPHSWHAHQNSLDVYCYWL